MTAPDSGVLEAIFFSEGETVEINTVVPFIGDCSKVGQHDAPAAATGGAALAKLAQTVVELVAEPEPKGEVAPMPQEETPVPATEALY